MTVNPIFMPVRELGELVRQRQASPVEIAEIFLQRLDSIGPRYNAVVTVTRERAMEQARRAESEIAAGDYKGLLHGIPYGRRTCWRHPAASRLLGALRRSGSRYSSMTLRWYAD